MKKLLILAALLIAGPTALADGPEKARVLEIEVPVSVRTEIYLRQEKRKTAAAADRLTGRDTYARALEKREAAKPRRYVPRTVKVKAKAKPK